MAIVLSSIEILVTGVIFLLLMGKTRSRRNEEIMGMVGFTCTILGVILSLAVVSVCIGNSVSMDIDYQNMLHKREMLEYRIEHMNEDITGNELLYNDIVEFNNELRGQKKWANSIWTNWFNNKYIADLDYIELRRE